MQDDNEHIVPIDFTPSSSIKKSRGFKLNPARIAIAAVLFCFASAAWFVLSAKSVFIDINPATSELSVNNPLAIKIGPRFLVREGDLPIFITAEGYYDLDTSLSITDAQAQTFLVELIRLPGFLNLNTMDVEDAEIIIDGEAIGTTPLSRIELAAGEHILLVQKNRYESVETIVDIEGRSTEQSLSLQLLPAWANVSLTTTPPGATVTVDGEEIGVTPLSAEILEGDHQIVVKLAAHKAWTEEFAITAREDLSIPEIELIEADGLVLLQSSPSNANITMNGNYLGQTPLEISVSPGTTHNLVFFLNGYEELSRSIRTNPDEEASINVNLEPRLSMVAINAQPSNAQLYVNGELMGNANQTLELLATSQLIEIQLEGYVPFQTEFISRPGLEQKLDITLKSLEQERIDSIKPVITTVTSQRLKLIYPAGFVMGASRREAGRQANEVLRSISLTRPYYLSLTEVTNAQYLEFDPEHSSGIIERRTLNNSNQPVVQVTWEQAALYCNWLSEQEALDPFYTVEGENISGFNPDSTGYRLPTEAEWAWAARVDGSPDSLLKFPWGAQLPPPENHGNYADISAASVLARILPTYNDSFLGTAPVGSFDPNSNGFYDMGGNAAEWTHDFYGTTGLLGNNQEVNPYGPETGGYHVVRGSSWAHGTVTELRLSYRDYSDEARDDVGFRIARNLEE
jgi:formylglycine-generating enzyme required for sulfatase activity